MSASVSPGEGLKIGELADRVGVSAHTLRAWEKRYGILKPSRTSGGYRLYGEVDVRRINAVMGLRAQGMSISEAVARVNASVAAQLPEGRPLDAAVMVREMHNATLMFDEVAAVNVLDRLLSSHTFDDAVRHFLMPFLVQLGAKWERGEVTVAHEHFASQLIRRRLDSYTLMWATGSGPLAVLACPPGEQHDIPLLVLGVLLSRAGWRIRYLGQETPVPDIHKACEILKPDAVVMAANRPRVFERSQLPLTKLAASFLLMLGGRGATPEVAQLLGAYALPLDVVTAAGELSARARNDGHVFEPRVGEDEVAVVS